MEPPPPSDRPALTDVASAVRALRDHGGRLTAAKESMLRYLHAAPGAVTAEDVQAALPEIDTATVYRNLAQFESAGIVSHRHYAHGAAIYRWARADTFPVVCEGCRAVVELDPREFADLATRVRARTGMTLVAGHFALTGWCASCAAPGEGSGTDQG